MRVFQSAVLKGIPGLEHATASLQAQPLTFSGHARKTVVGARKEFLHVLHTQPAQLVLGHQVHGNRIRIVGRTEAGAGAVTPATYLASTDGLLTQRPDLALGLFTADCVPVLLADPLTGWIGALHVGWRGAVNGIVPKALQLLEKQGVDLRPVRVWLGPSICATHYVVDAVRAKQLSRTFHGKAVTRQKEGFTVDLRRGILHQLIRQGVRHAHVEVSATCTYEDHRLPSARRDGPTHANTLTAITRHAQPYDLRGKRVVVYGLGVQGGGEAAVRFAVKQHAHVTAADAKPASAFLEVRQRLRDLPVQYAFGARRTRYLAAADVIIKNPGVPAADAALQQATRRGAMVTSDLSLFRALSKNPVIAITGTKGKTTVATWLAALLRTREKHAVLAGNVRHSPLLEPHAYDGRTPVVLELSSFQLEALEVSLAPKLALVTNLYPDHLDRHKTMRAYAAVKARITEGQTSTGTLIAPLDSEWRRHAHLRTKAKVYWTSDTPKARANAFIEKHWIVLRTQGKQKRIMAVSKLKQQDIGSVRCAVSVALAGSLLGYSTLALRRVLASFRGVPERFEVVGHFRGRTFINNTTATNPASAVAGIASVRGRCVVIAGGTDKGLPKRELVRALQTAAAVVFLPGTATKLIAPQVRVPATHVASMSAAVRAALRYAKPGDTVLLSPGAASFGLFRNEFDRGAQFVRAVRALR